MAKNTAAALASVLSATGGEVPLPEVEELPAVEGMGEVPMPEPSEVPMPNPSLAPVTETTSRVEIPAAVIEAPAAVIQSLVTVKAPRAARDPEEIEREALEDAMMRFRSEWFSYATRQVGEESAGDAMQEVWVRLWQKRKEVARPSEWMYGCLRNVLREMQDPGRVEELREAHLETLSDDSSQGQSLAQQDSPSPDEHSLDLLIQVVNLTDQEREALTLRRLGVAPRVIAERMGLTYRSVVATLDRARTKLKAHVEAGDAILKLAGEQ